MMISTKGRYALRVLIDLAEHQGEGCIPMKDVAARQGISLKYLEKIMPILAGRLVEGQKGKGGGYRLSRPPEECRVGEVLRLMEGDLAPVACLEGGAEPCLRAAQCRTVGMWRRFHRLINDYFDGISLADLMREKPSDNYVI